MAFVFVTWGEIPLFYVRMFFPLLFNEKLLQYFFFVSQNEQFTSICRCFLYMDRVALDLIEIHYSSFSVDFLSIREHKAKLPK
jgi:hypothetical protein